MQNYDHSSLRAIYVSMVLYHLVHGGSWHLPSESGARRVVVTDIGHVLVESIPIILLK